MKAISYVDYGGVWVRSSAPNASWSAITSDASGQHLAACQNPGYIYMSSSYGTTWTQASANSGSYLSMSSESTFQY